jgi:hypothetical protein
MVLPPRSIETLHLDMDSAWPFTPQIADGDGVDLPSDEQQALPSQLLSEQVHQHVKFCSLLTALLNMIHLPP